jgi:hypothetical protein
VQAHWKYPGQSIANTMHDQTPQPSLPPSNRIAVENVINSLCLSLFWIYDQQATIKVPVAAIHFHFMKCQFLPLLLAMQTNIFSLAYSIIND